MLFHLLSGAFELDIKMLSGVICIVKVEVSLSKMEVSLSIDGVLGKNT